MDDDIRQSLTDIKQSLRDGFVDMNDRIDKLVTKEAFDAQITRLDQADRNQRERIASHEKSNDEDFQSIRSTAKWAIGICLTAAAGVIAAIAAEILQLVSPHL